MSAAKIRIIENTMSIAAYVRSNESDKREFRVKVLEKKAAVKRRIHADITPGDILFVHAAVGDKRRRMFDEYARRGIAVER